MLIVGPIERAIDLGINLKGEDVLGSDHALNALERKLALDAVGGAEGDEIGLDGD